MLINSNDEKEMTIPCMNNGTGMMTAKMFVDNGGKIITCSIQKGGSIGTHKHETSDDINYVLSGEGKAICDGIEEILAAGSCHICKKGSEHTIFNTGHDDLVLLTVVVER
ncbi:MAG: cupin domain-containing protein [Clostridia bacterium]|nr:cupin domain-containing protein [Clostridia bacterium]